ncbi:MAG: KH domain-containing protein [Vulcanimicrobiaceae bacterium]
MSAFDDEFGLFGDQTKGEDDERRSTLGARRIASGETIIDEIEPEDEPAPRRWRGVRPAAGAAPEGGWIRRRTAAPSREHLGDDVLYPRATDLLLFLAKGLVSKPEVVAIGLRTNDRGGVLELEVDADDLGKVIGRGGRVAQALRTIVRAGAEGRVTVDILDVDDDDEDEADDPGDAPASDGNGAGGEVGNG